MVVLPLFACAWDEKKLKKTRNKTVVVVLLLGESKAG